MSGSRRITITLVLILSGCGASLSSVAQEEPCDGPSYMHGAKCVADKREVAEQELDRAYQDALRRARSEDQFRLERGLEAIYGDLLVESQRVWRKYTDIDCELSGLASGAGGPWVGVHASECVYHNTRKRIVVLNGLWAG